MTKAIQILTALLVLLIAAASFILSYHSLYQVGLENKAIQPEWAWLWPLLLDAGLVVFSMAVLTTHLEGEKAVYAWGLVSLYTLGTIIFNVLAVPQNLVAQIIAASKPITLFFSFHLLMQTVERSVKRREIGQAVKTLAGQLDHKRQEMAQMLSQKQAEIDKLNSTIEDKRGQLDQLKQDIKQARLEGQAGSVQLINAIRQEKIAQRRGEVLRLLSEGMDQNQMASVLNVSTKTIKRDVAAVQNGKGD